MIIVFPKMIITWLHETHLLHYHDYRQTKYHRNMNTIKSNYCVSEKSLNMRFYQEDINIKQEVAKF